MNKCLSAYIENDRNDSSELSKKLRQLYENLKQQGNNTHNDQARDDIKIAQTILLSLLIFNSLPGEKKKEYPALDGYVKIIGINLQSNYNIVFNQLNLDEMANTFQREAISWIIFELIFLISMSILTAGFMLTAALFLEPLMLFMLPLALLSLPAASIIFLGIVAVSKIHQYSISDQYISESNTNIIINLRPENSYGIFGLNKPCRSENRQLSAEILSLVSRNTL